MRAATAEEINGHIRNLDPNSFKVAFFIDRLYGSGQDRWMDALAAVLRKRGYYTIALVSIQCVGDALLTNTDASFRVDRDELVNLKGIQVFIISDTDCWIPYPQESRILANSHALLDNLDGPDPEAYLAAHVDGYIWHTLPAQERRERIIDFWTGFVSPGYNYRKDTPFYIMPIGDMALAQEMRQLRERAIVPDAILYAPGEVKFLPAPANKRIRQYTRELISYLLKEFPDFRIIFRPASPDSGNPGVKALAEEFAGESNFILDQDPDRDLSFARAAIVITDISGIEHDFAFTTLRGAISYQPWRTEGIGMTETDCGYMTATLADLGNTVRQLYSDREKVAARLLRLRKERLAKPESAFEDVADSLEDFHALRARPEWITIERRDDFAEPFDFQLVRKILDIERRDLRAWTALRAFSYHNPKNPLLAAFAFHMAVLHLPARPIIPDQKRELACLLNSPVAIKKMAEIPLELIRGLYHRSLHIRDKFQFTERMALVYELLQDFETKFPVERRFTGQYFEPSRRRQYNGWSIVVMPRKGARLSGIIIPCIYLKTNKVLKVRIFRYERNVQAIKISSLAEIHHAEFALRELNIIESTQEICFPLEIRDLVPGQPYLFMVEGDGFIGAGRSADDLRVSDYMFRGYRSVRNDPDALLALWGTNSIAYELIYK